MRFNIFRWVYQDHLNTIVFAILQKIFKFGFRATVDLDICIAFGPGFKRFKRSIPFAVVRAKAFCFAILY